MPDRRRTVHQWPWITLVLSALLALNPFGLDFIRVALSGDQLSRNILGPILLMVAVALVALGFAEWVLRRYVLAQRMARTDRPLD